MNKKIIIIAVVAVIVVVGAIGAIVLTRDKEPPPLVLGVFSPGDNFVLNAADGDALFKCAMMLLIDQTYQEQMTTDEAMAYTIRDTIILTLRGISEEELRNIKAIDQIKEKIVADLNKKLPPEGENAGPLFHGVLFSDYVLQ